jgi:superfamily II DNA helicase RecQ
MPKDVLGKVSGLGKEEFAAALEKLWIHGGARISGEDLVTRGDAGWRRRYEAQRAHQEQQLEGMARFTDAHGCRMLQILRHFGDQADSGRPCGLCDVCASASCVAQEHRGPTPADLEVLERILNELRQRGSRAMGSLFSAVFSPEEKLDRKTFEALIGALARAKLVTVEDASFERGTETIAFRRVVLTPEGKAAEAERLTELSIVEPKKSKRVRKRRRPFRRGSKRGSGAGQRGRSRAKAQRPARP